MSWYQEIEQKKKLLVGGTISICLAMLAVTARRNNLAFDSYWHLQAGLDWINKGLSPWRDHFSFTFQNELITGPPYIFQATIASLVNGFGQEFGLQLYMLLGFLSCFVLLILFLRSLRASTLVYCMVLPMVVFLLQLRALVRPELISYSLSVLALFLYQKARSGISTVNMILIVALMWVWSNHHSPVVGYVIFFGLFLDLAVLQWREMSDVRVWVKWLGWGALTVGVGFLNPDLSHPILRLLSFPAEWKDLIQEYQSSKLFLSVAATYALMGFALITLVLLVWKRQTGFLVVSLILIFHSAGIARLVTPAGIVLMCIFAVMMSEIDFKALLSRSSGGLQKFLGGLALVWFFMSVSSGVSLARAFMAENQTSEIIFPHDVVDYMKEQGFTGRLFNEYQTGGYLISRLSPESQVYIDGRTEILYPVSHYQRYDLARNNPQVLWTELEEYDIDYVILENKDKRYSAAYDSGLVGLDFVGASFSLFTRENAGFPAFGSLLAHPACFDSQMMPKLQSEQAGSLFVLRGNSPLFSYMDLVLSYGAAADKSEFILGLESRSNWTDSERRFIGYQALNYDLHLVALDLFSRVSDADFRDFLATAIASVHLGENGNAENVLDQATRINWPHMRITDLAILQRILRHMQQNAPLEKFDESYLEQLDKNVGELNDAFASDDFDDFQFCSVKETGTENPGEP